MKEVFLGHNHSDLTNAIAINAAFSLTLTGVEEDLKKAFLLAGETIKSGKAYEKLEELAS
jgi:anthranilate phosphoribosyltransferase